MHGCASGIALFERLTEEDFNPNVSLEVGYMLALGKEVCLLKDQNLKHLHTDLIGSLYDSIDVLNPKITVPSALDKWMKDKGMI